MTRRELNINIYINVKLMKFGDSERLFSFGITLSVQLDFLFYEFLTEYWPFRNKLILSNILLLEINNSRSKHLELSVFCSLSATSSELQIKIL